MSCSYRQSSVPLRASSHIFSVIYESLLMNQLARYFQRVMLRWSRDFLHICSPQCHRIPSLKPSTTRIFHTFTRSVTDYAKSRKTEEELSKFYHSPTDALASCLKNNFKIYIKTAPTCFGVKVTPSSLICVQINAFPDDGVTVTQKNVGAVLM